MADPMLKLMHGKCGPGGLHCYCCNTRMKKTKAVLRRWARRKLKDDDRKEQD